MSLELRTPEPGLWTTGLCEWHQDCTSCMEGCCCICCQLSSQYNMLTKHIPTPDDLCTCLLCSGGSIMIPIANYRIRVEIRERYGIAGSRLGDCMMAVFCAPCASVQQHKEMLYRGQFPGGLCVEFPQHLPIMPQSYPMGVAPHKQYGTPYTLPIGGGGSGVGMGSSSSNSNVAMGGSNKHHHIQQTNDPFAANNNPYSGGGGGGGNPYNSQQHNGNSFNQNSSPYNTNNNSYQQPQHQQKPPSNFRY